MNGIFNQSIVMDEHAIIDCLEAGTAVWAVDSHFKYNIPELNRIE